jgi:hypothetical protein
VEFAVDLGSDLRWVKPTILCWRPTNVVFQLKTLLAEVQLCFVRERLLFSVLL